MVYWEKGSTDGKKVMDVKYLEGNLIVFYLNKLGI